MRHALALGLMALLGWGLVGCESKPNPASPVTAAAAAPPAVPAPAPDTAFIASGPLVVENQLDVATQREGVVARIMAEPGAVVKTGQVLAMLDDRQIAADREAAAARTRAVQANLKNWEADLEVVRSDLERAQKMWEAQLITKEQLEHARYKVVADEFQVQREREELRNVQAGERSLELEFEKTRIRAPFDGLVARRYVRAGQKVALGDRMFWVTAVAPLRVRFTLPEKYFGQIKTGQELGVVPAGDGGSSHKAKVIQLSPVVDPSSGTLEVLAEVVGPAGELRPGMTVNLRLDIAQ